MKYLKNYTLLFAMLLLAFQAVAQGGKDERHEKLDAARTAFLTDKMNLSTDQAQKFWPVYNEYEAKRKDLRHKARPFKKADLEAMSDQQVKDNLKSMFENRQKELNLDKEYAEKFQKVISARQLAAMYRAEHEFMKVLLKKLNTDRGHGPGED